MVTRFGSREVCDVTFKAVTNNQKVGNKEFNAGQLVFMIDTATATNMEQGETEVFARGGMGNPTLIGWSGEKTLTFTVTDALMSPLGLAVLTGAGLSKDEDTKHVHLTYDVALNETGTGTIDFESLCDELKLPLTRTLSTGEVVDNTIHVCVDNNVRPQALVLDNNGGIVDWVAPQDISLIGMDSNEDFNIIDLDSENPITVNVSGGAANGRTIKLDFYVKMNSGATEITVRPEDFGGYFYVEADTLYRNQDGKDMAATITLPRCKVSSNFTLSMAPTGDPSTFDFTLTAMPGYTYFDRSKKVMWMMNIVSGENVETSGTVHTPPTDHEKRHTLPVEVSKLELVAADENEVASQENQDNITITKSGNNAYRITLDEGKTLNSFVSTNPAQGKAEWIGLVINTGQESILGLNFNGSPLTQTDVEEAESVGVGDGSFVLWVKYENLPMSFVLTDDNGVYDDTTTIIKK